MHSSAGRAGSGRFTPRGGGRGGRAQGGRGSPSHSRGLGHDKRKEKGFYDGPRLSVYSDGSTNLLTWKTKMQMYLQRTYGVVAGDLLTEQGYRDFEVEPIVETILDMRERLVGEDNKARRQLEEKMLITAWESKMKEAQQKRMKYEESLPMIHAELMAAADDRVFQLWERSAEYSEAFSSVEDPLKLVRVIYETCVNSANQAEGEEDIRNDTVTTFYSMSQLQSETTMDFKRRIETQAVLVESKGGFGVNTDAIGVTTNVKAPDSLMANIMLKGLNLAVPRNFAYKTEVDRQVVFDPNQRPKTMEEILRSLSSIKDANMFSQMRTSNHANYALRGGRNNRGRSGRGGGRQRGGGPATTEARKEKLHKDQCRRCGEFGHWGNECPKSDKDIEDMRKETSDDKPEEEKKRSRMIRLPTAGNDDGDIEFYTSKMIRSELISKGKCHVVSKRVPENELIGFDTMSNVTIYTNQNYVEGVRKLKESIEVETMAGLYRLEYTALAKLDGKLVYFAPGGGINIQSAFEYRSLRRLGDDGHDYLQLEDGEELHFHWNEQLAVAHLEPVINRLEKMRNVVMATELRGRSLNQREIEAAVRARDFKERCMNRTSEEIVRTINNGVISGIRVSTQDVMNDLKLNGQLTREIKGKERQRLDQLLPRGFKYEDLLRKDKDTILHGDVVHYGKCSFLYLVDNVIGLQQSLEIRERNRTGAVLVRKLEAGVATYNAHRWRIMYYVSDSDTAVISAETSIKMMHVELEVKASGTHVKLAEICWQWAAARFRGIEAEFLQSTGIRLTSLAISRGIVWTVRQSNLFQTSIGFPGVSAFEGLTGVKPSAERFFRGKFGTICEVRVYRQTKDKRDEKTVTAMMIGMTGNLEGAMEFQSINTGKKISSAQWKEVRINEGIRSRFNYLADNETLKKAEEVDESEVKAIEEEFGMSNEILKEEDNSHVASTQNSIEAREELQYKSEKDLVREEYDAAIGDIRAVGLEEEFDGELATAKDESTQEATTGAVDYGPQVEEHAPGPPSTTEELQESRTMSMSLRQLFGIYFKKGSGRYFKSYHIQFKRALEKYGRKGVTTALEELRQLHEFRTWDAVKISTLSKEQRRRIIQSSLFFKEKFFADGSFDKLKARLVAGGHMQDKSLYDDLSSPTVNLASVFMVACVAARDGEYVMAVDVTGAYLNAKVKDEVLMRLNKPIADLLVRLDSKYEEYRNDDGSMVVKLNRALYGLVQSAKLWYEHLSGTLERNGYRKLESDECVFVKTDENGNLVKIVLHVDDMLVMCKDKGELIKFEKLLKGEYKDIKVSNGPIVSYLGMQFDFSKDGEVTITMPGYVKELIAYYGIEGNAVSPHTEKLFEINEESPLLSSEDQDAMRSATASLLYLARRTYPELLPVTAHLTTRVGKYTTEDEGKFVRAMKYLNTYPNGGVTLRAGSGDIQIHAYVDASHGVHADGRSHTGCVITLGSGSVFTRSGKQKAVSRSSTEAELIALSDSLPTILWARQFLKDMGIEIGPVQIHEDNTSTIALAERGKSNKGMTKHVKVRYFLVKQYIDEGEIEIRHTRTEDMWADLLTKPVMGSTFWRLLSKVTGQQRSKVGMGAD